MNKLFNGKLYDTDNPAWVLMAEYRSGNESEVIYRATDGNYIRHRVEILKTDVPTPPAEILELLGDINNRVTQNAINNFRGKVYWEKFESV